MRAKSPKSKVAKKRDRIVVLCVIIFIVAMSVACFRLRKQSQKLGREKAQIEAQITKEKDKKKELRYKKEYVKSKKFIEKMAREKFGLLYADEYILKEK